MEKSEPQTKSALLLEDHHAPEVYVSQLLRCDFDAASVVRLTFVSNHADANSPTGYSQCVNLRLVMSPSALENLCDFAGKWLANTKAVNEPSPPNPITH